MKKLLYAVAAIVVSLSAVSCSEETKSTSVEPMNIEFWEVCDYQLVSELSTFFYEGHADALVIDGLKASGKSHSAPFSTLILPEYPFVSPNGVVITWPVGFNFVMAADASNVDTISEYLELEPVKAELERITGGSVKFAWSRKNTLNEAGDGVYVLYALQGFGGLYPAMDGSGIVEAKAVPSTFNDTYEVSITFDDKASMEWGRLTQRNIGRNIAIVGNGRVIVNPVVNGPISGGRVTLSGNFTKAEAEALAKSINAN